MLIGELNAEESGLCPSQFLFEVIAKITVKEPTYNKNLSSPNCIDLPICR